MAETAPATWSPFSYIVVNLARFIRPEEITFSGVNSTMPMLACLLAKRAYDFPFTYINVAGGVDPTPSHIPISSSDPVLAEQSASIFANEDFYDLCTRGRMDLTFLGAAQIDGEGCANNSVIGDWHRPKVRLPGGGGGAVMLPTAHRALAPYLGREARFPHLLGRLPWRGHPDRGVHQAQQPPGTAVLAPRVQPGRGA
jgi:glutaconate CoA-transferase, subunit B